MLSNTLIIMPHMDDEIFSCGGYILKYKDTNNIKVISICSGRENQDKTRKETFFKIGKLINVNFETYGYTDLKLLNSDRIELTNKINKDIQEFNPDIVITSHCNDMHFEHVLVSECVKVASRKVKELYEVYSPASSYISNDYFDVFVDVSKQIETKNKLAKLYVTENIPEFSNIERLKTIWRKI